MADAQFDQPETRPEHGAQAWDVRDLPCFLRRLWFRNRSQRSRPDLADGVGTCEIGSGAEVGADKTRDCPSPRLERPFSCVFPNYRASGRPSTVPIVDIL